MSDLSASSWDNNLENELKELLEKVILSSY